MIARIVRYISSVVWTQLKCNRYHWAFLIGPKIEDSSSKGTRCHVKELLKLVDEEKPPQNTWVYEDLEINMQRTVSILVKVAIGKVADRARLVETFAETPIRAGAGEHESWNCVSWAEDALKRAVQDGKALGTCCADWERVRDTAMEYVKKKAAEHRFDGEGQFDETKVATWDEMEGKKIPSESTQEIKIHQSIDASVSPYLIPPGARLESYPLRSAKKDSKGWRAMPL